MKKNSQDTLQLTTKSNQIESKNTEQILEKNTIETNNIGKSNIETNNIGKSNIETNNNGKCNIETNNNGKSNIETNNNETNIIGIGKGIDLSKYVVNNIGSNFKKLINKDPITSGLRSNNITKESKIRSSKKTQKKSKHIKTKNINNQEKRKKR